MKESKETLDVALELFLNKYDAIKVMRRLDEAEYREFFLKLKTLIACRYADFYQQKEIKMDCLEKKTMEEYVYERMPEPGKRLTANIIFVNGIFSECDFTVSNNTKYTYEDWLWLKDIAEEIIKLVEEHKGI